MYFPIYVLTLTFLAISHAQETSLQDGCPKGSLECMDVINSSQCIEQIVIEKRGTLSKKALEACVVYEGMSSEVAGSVKFCKCPGCHSEAINKVIEEMFPPPCA
ncbi:hypothetical protein BKA65DRAFT_517459 [Rhexocercosporidium sp. MPI-PUGE-AT-0058]|nr:hypothetical protein BKA65DRAFT_517459 [Rhexocercosporidium sp. MPI-PUGE-AT-0058]